VVIDANGQLGTVNPETGGGIPFPLSTRAPNPAPNGAVNGASVAATVAQLRQQVRDQQTTIADLTARLARLEQLLAPAAVGR
jgi:hypothetical protein